MISETALSAEVIGIWIGSIGVFLTLLHMVKSDARKKRRKLYERVEKAEKEIRDFKDRFIFTGER